MTATVTPTIEDEIVRLTALVDEASAEFTAGRAVIDIAAAELATIDAQLHTDANGKLRLSDVVRVDLRTRQSALRDQVLTGNRRCDAAMKDLTPARSHLRQALELRAEMATVRPAADLQAELNAARTLLSELTAQLADARERRIAALTSQSASALREADQRLRDLPADVEFAEQHVIECEIAVYAGAAVRRAADLWVAQQDLVGLLEAQRAAKDAHDAGVALVRNIEAERTRFTLPAEQLKTKLEHRRAGLFMAWPLAGS